ncbi:PREDICTED: uncharacterized protein LOC106126573 [Papilio xuthus]|uniref:Uncharacterized protein LOC106126573 n=1 Tax=Papilio xuthus TaxID=66420 RepID=I4DL73_PAPXU|nr:uncharacterized protein LOC106126573 [Papilio xuthus]KPI96964.1 hypothetical protein RR46_05581 [Papilio xuthus]BAM18663.1 unknown unsecreted protein [Papilio xuthus]
MVLTGVHHSYGFNNSRFVPKSDSEALILTLENIVLKLCEACQSNMASIPPSAFSAKRIRETERNMKISNIDKRGPSSKVFNTNMIELTPLKYNSKLMNSIWGSYNRYSPHNVKKVNDAVTFNVELQPSAANSSNKNEPMIILPAPKLENFWASINISQSQI